MESLLGLYIMFRNKKPGHNQTGTTQESPGSFWTRMTRRHPTSRIAISVEGSFAVKGGSTAVGLADIRGPKDPIGTRILHSGSKAPQSGIPEKMLRRILVFMWSFNFWGRMIFHIGDGHAVPK